MLCAYKQSHICMHWNLGPQLRTQNSLLWRLQQACTCADDVQFIPLQRTLTHLKCVT